MVTRSALLIACGALHACVGLELDRENFACNAGGACDEAEADAAVDESIDAGVPVIIAPNDAGVEGDAGATNDAGADDAGAQTRNDAQPAADATAYADAQPRPDAAPIPDTGCETGPAGQWNRITPNGAIARAGHTAVLDTRRNRALFFGGAGADQNVAALSLASPYTFTTIAASGGPSGRREHGATYDPTFDQLVLFGGRNPSNQLLADTWTMSLADETWDANDDLPSPREAPAAAFANQPFLFGGCSASGALQDLLFFQPGAGIWIEAAQLSPPGARCDSVAVAVPERAGTVMIGGRSPGALDDVWVLGLWWESVVVSGPSARYGETAVWDLANARILLFGGAEPGPNGETYLGDLWALKVDGTKCWQPLSPSGPEAPSPRSQHTAFMYGGDMYLYGGTDDIAGDDLSLWQLEL